MLLTFLREIGAGSAALTRAEKYLCTPPYPPTELPIHPRVSAHYKLSYGRPKHRYQFYQESRLTFEEYFRQYIAGSYNAFMFAGLHYLRSGKLPAAVDNLQKAIDQSERSAGCHAALAEALLRSGQTNSALNAASHAARLEPASPAHSQLIAEIRAEAGDFEGARESLQSAITKGAEPGPIYRKIATIAIKQTRHAEGVLLLQGILHRRLTPWIRLLSPLPAGCTKLWVTWPPQCRL